MEDSMTGKKLMRLGILVFILLGAFTACSKDKQVDSDDKILIGLSLDSIVVERWQRELEILVATVNELGAEIDVQIANESIDKQTEQIKYLINRHVDVLIVVPNDAKAFYDVMSEAERNGIDVIAYDRLIMHPDIDLYISFDNVAIGKGISQRLMDQFKSDAASVPEEEFTPYRLLIINGDPKDNNSKLLNQGFYEAIQPYIEDGLITVVDETWANEWREQYAKDLVEEYLSKGERIDGIIAANDVLATGAIEVLSKWQKAGSVYVVSQDAELSACQRIVENTQLATAYKPIYDLATTTAKIAISMAKGEKVLANDSIYNEYVTVPFLKLDAYVVDMDNMDSVIIKSGFHRKEDIYRNIDTNDEEGDTTGTDAPETSSN